MIKFIQTTPNKKSTGFNAQGKLIAVRSLKDYYAQKNKKSST